MVQLLRAIYSSRLLRHDNFQYWSMCRAESISELEYICHSNILQPPPLDANILPRFLCYVFLLDTYRNIPYVQFANHGPAKLSCHEYYTRANMVVAPHRSTPYQDAGRNVINKDGLVWKAPHSDAMHITRHIRHRCYFTYHTLLFWSMEDRIRTGS